MASFGVVGSYLRDKYQNGVRVTVDQNGYELVLAEGEHTSRPARDDLVFLEESPDYCVPDSNTGSLGTGGRICIKFDETVTRTGRGNCGTLCCRRGFNAIQIEEEYKCRCKFNWCCDVKCKTCTRTVKKHVCKSQEEFIAAKNNSLSEFTELFVRNFESYDPSRAPHKSRKAKLGKRARKNKKRGASNHDNDKDD